MEVTITKASGAKEPFQKNKLLQSLIRAGASNILAEKIAAQIDKSIRPGMTTKHIYLKAHESLKRASGPAAGRYFLKTGIMELGPSGFPFEKYISEILNHKGYAVQIGVITEGKCVKHEIDVVAEKDNQHFMIECKFHNSAGLVCDVKIPLYIQARFKDVEAQWMQAPGHASKFHQGWVVTNTRFTSDAITYGTCVGLHLVSLDFPYESSLRMMIEETGLYPLTCLTTLTLREKKTLLEKKIVLCRDICANPQLLNEIGTVPKRIEQILKEGQILCDKKHGGN